MFSSTTYIKQKWVYFIYTYKYINIYIHIIIYEQLFVISLSIYIYIYILHKSINGYSFKVKGPVLLIVKNLAQHFSHDNYSQPWRSLINIIVPFSYTLSTRTSTIPVWSPKHNQLMDMEWMLCWWLGSSSFQQCFCEAYCISDTCNTSSLIFIFCQLFMVGIVGN